MAKRTRGARMVRVKKRARNMPKGKGRVRFRAAGEHVMHT